MSKRFSSFRPDEFYHATVMPCYDKKLEASREDFFNDLYRTRDVDCVVSTSKFIHRRTGSYGNALFCTCAVIHMIGFSDLVDFWVMKVKKSQ